MPKTRVHKNPRLGSFGEGAVNETSRPLAPQSSISVMHGPTSTRRTRTAPKLPTNLADFPARPSRLGLVFRIAPMFSYAIPSPRYQDSPRLVDRLEPLPTCTTPGGGNGQPTSGTWREAPEITYLQLRDTACTCNLLRHLSGTHSLPLMDTESIRRLLFD